jgi:molybdate transport system substrate-binding protein
MSSPNEIAILSAHVMTALLAEPLAAFERDSACRLAITSVTSGAVKPRILAGEPFELVLGTQVSIDDLVAQGQLMTGVVLATSIMGVAIKSGAARPDIGSVAAFRAALLAARSLAYADPASSSPSGNHIVGILARLGIADAMRPKTVLVASQNGRPIVVAETVAAGAAELGIQQIAEIKAVVGAEVLGSLPAELQLTTGFSAGLGHQAGPQAKALIEALGSSRTGDVISAKGMTAVGAVR